MSLTRADGTVTASWPSVSGATKYHVTYSSDGMQSWSAAPCGTSCTGVSVTITADNDKSYVVGVRAGNNNDQWSGWRNSDSIGPYVPPPPSAPSSVDVTRADGTLTASGYAASNATKYHITYSSDGGQSWTAASDNHAGSSITITGVDNGESYVVGVRAGNSSGWSGWTNSGTVGPFNDEETSESQQGDPPASQPDSLARVQWIEVGERDYYNGRYGFGWKKVANATGYHITAHVNGNWKAVAVHAAGNQDPTRSDWLWINLTAGQGCLNLDKGDKFIVDIRPIYWTGEGAWPGNESSENFVAGPWHGTPKTPKFTAGRREVCNELTVSNVGVTTATLTIDRYSGGWYYKANAAPDNSCKGPVSGSTKELTGLSANTAYTYSAYSDSNCSPSHWLDTAPQFTTLSSVSNLASTKQGSSGIHNSLKAAVAFTTGSNSGGYILESVTAPLKHQGNRDPNLAITLHAMEGSGEYSSTSQPSDTVLATLSGAAPTTATWTNMTYTCNGVGCNLSPDTTYFVVAAASEAYPAYEWAYATTESETALPSDNGWSIGFGHYKHVGALDWGSYSDWNIAELVFATK